MNSNHENKQTADDVTQDSLSFNIDDKREISKVKQLALKVCKEYLGGAWKTIGVEELKITRILGGLTNYIYLCEIESKTVKKVGREPMRVIFRLYGIKKNFESLLKLIVISTIIGLNSLGPRIYGQFMDGQLEEYIPYPMLNNDAETMVKRNRSIARAIARFHSLDMPVSQEPEWTFNFLNQLNQQAMSVKPQNQNDIEKYNKFLSFDITNEIKKIKKVIDSLNSPIVFSSNDIAPDNLLDTPDRVTIIDYEMAGYNSRGFDLGCIFGKWMLNTNVNTPPYFSYNPECRLSRELQVEFIEAYLNEFTLAIKEKFENDEKQEDRKESSFSSSLQHYLDSFNLNVESLVTESNFFELVSHLIFGIMAVTNINESETYNFNYMDYALARFQAYYDRKKVLFPNDY